MSKEFLQSAGDIGSQDLFSRAVELGYSTKGEIFSIYNLKSLCDETFGGASKIIDLKWDGAVVELVKHTLMGHPSLLCYDAEKNNLPGTLGGESPHYIVIVGIMLPEGVLGLVGQVENVADRNSSNFVTARVTKKEGTVLYSNIRFARKLAISSSIELNDEYLLADSYVICQHSRSRHPFLTRLSHLLDSSRQMDIVSVFKGSEYVVPESSSVINGLALVLLE